MWKAKPLPVQIRVGIDICFVPRFLHILERDEARSRSCGLLHLEQLATRVFSHLEWPHLASKVLAYRRQPDDSVQRQRLAYWLGGRWAAKEAAVKAHSKRRLYMRQISVLAAAGNSETLTSTGADPNADADPGPVLKPVVLIDPPERFVVMNADVARKRCLRSPANETSSVSRVNNITTASNDWITQRKRKVTMDIRRLADVSISHDGDYAVAICQALDEDFGLEQPIVDDGHGEPFHEPEPGDEGFVDLRSFRSFLNKESCG